MSDLAAALQLMKSRDFDGAACVLSAMLDAKPEDGDALYALAMAERGRGRPEAALNALVRLRNVRPGYGRGLQEEGQVLLGLGRTTEAKAAFEDAVACNPGLVPSWEALAALHQHMGDSVGAGEAAARVERLKRLPSPLLAVLQLTAEGMAGRALQMMRAHIDQHPDDAEAMRLAGQAAMRLGLFPESEGWLEKSLACDPQNIAARLDLVNVLSRQQKMDQALAVAQALRSDFSDEENIRLVYADALVAAGRNQEALTELKGFASPHYAADLTRALANRNLGKRDEAVTSYRAAIKADPAHGEPWWGLANLKTYRFSNEDREAMLNRAAAITLPHDRAPLEFALGKALEDAQEFDEAFAHYAKGNALKRSFTPYFPDYFDEEVTRLKETYTEDLLKSAGEGEGPVPVFIVGLPRAGSTLVEQILASHSQVAGTFEMPYMNLIAAGLQAAPSEGELEALGARYLEDTEPHRSGAHLFTDKMPNNFRHVGLIKMILPQAKVIDVRRLPMANGFAAFKHLFADGHEFSYSLEDIGRYTRAYVDLMDHWDRVLPGAVLRISYEDLVTDFEAQVRRMLDYCGLPFEEACLEFYRTERTIRTASSEQVREPLNTRGLDQWRNFEAHLEPLRAALGGLS